MQIGTIFKGRRIVVLGDLMVDRFVRGDASRISPEAPVPVVAVQEEVMVLGGAANVAHNVASLGGEPLLVGVVGADDAGRGYGSLLARAGMDGSGLVTDPERPTTVKTRIIARGQQMVRVDWEETAPVPRKVEEALERALGSAVPGSDGVVISDYAKGVVTPGLFAFLLRLAGENRVPVLLDPKPSQAHIYGEVDLMTPNLAEAEAMTGLVRERDGVEAILEALRARFGCRAGVVVTLGPGGMAYLGGSGKPATVPTLAREVFDVTGAGDTAVAAIALSLAAGLSLDQAVAVANAAAGVVVGKMGTALASVSEVEAMLRELAQVPGGGGR